MHRIKIPQQAFALKMQGGGGGGGGGGAICGTLRYNFVARLLKRMKKCWCLSTMIILIGTSP